MSHKSTYSPGCVIAALLAGLLASGLGGAEPRGCGRPRARGGDSTVEIRFIPAPMEQVKANLLRAFPTLALRLTKEKGGLIEAKMDSSLAGSASSVEAQATRGTIYIELAPGKQGGASGVVLRIDTSVIGNYATALADEVDCLVGLLSPVDPSSNPRGLTSLSPPASAREVSVPAKTVFKVALRDYLYTKDLAANASAGPVLEVVEDVAVDGVTVFRKGALAKGKLTEAAAAKSAAHGGSLQLALESATAVDGQEIAVEG